MRHCLFLGDAHIVPEDKAFQGRLARFLVSLPDRYDHLFVMGDLFEFWFGFEGYSYEEEYGPVLEAFRYIASRGIQIVYFEGNHDFCMGSIFTEELQAHVYPDAHSFEVNGKRWFVTHGDLVAAEGLRYGTYRKLIRNPFTYGLIRLLGPERILKIARRLGAMSHKVYHTPEAYDATKYTTFVKKKFACGYDAVIMGHTHRAGVITYHVGDKKRYYVNCGDVKNAETYVTYHPDRGFEVQRGLDPLPGASKVESG